MSSTIYKEVIEIMGKSVLKTIINVVREAKYYSISVDSPPDISHTDQLTVILRYVKKGSAAIVERFLHFMPNLQPHREVSDECCYSVFKRTWSRYQ